MIVNSLSIYRPISASSIHSEISKGKSPAFVMLLEAIHVELWAAYAVVVMCFFFLIKPVKVSFQYRKSYDKTL